MENDLDDFELIADDLGACGLSSKISAAPEGAEALVLLHGDAPFSPASFCSISIAQDRTYRLAAHARAPAYPFRTGDR